MNKKDATQLMISADPLAIYIAVKCYKNRLRKFVDNFFVGIHTAHYWAPHPDNPTNDEMVELTDFFNNLIKDDPDIKFVYPHHDYTTQHGTMLNALVKEVYDDCKSNLLITETDDFFVNADMLENHVDRMNRGDYDFVGEPRGCTNNQQLIEFERKVVKEDKVLVNDSETPGIFGEFTHYWPTHFLIKKQFVKKDDRFEAFGANGDELGKTINNTEINYRGRKFYVENTCGDTFVKFSIDMMSRVNKGYEFQPFPYAAQHLPDAEILYFLNRGLVNTPLFKIPDNMVEIALKQFSLHTGSGSSLQMFPIIKDTIKKQSLFRQIQEFAEKNDNYQLFELYRRYSLYRAGFETVQDDPEFAIFRERCLNNFAQLEQAFVEAKVEERMKEAGNWLIPRSVYVETFKHIVGK